MSQRPPETTPPSQRPRVLIAEPTDFSAEALSLLRTQAEVQVVDVPPGQLKTNVEGFDAVWVRLKHRIEKSMLSGTSIRAVACPVTGLDHIDLKGCDELGIRVVSLKGEIDFLKQVRATAELTVGLALALLRHIPRASQSVLAGEWARDRFRGHELFEATAGIVGLGRLGTLVAGYLKAFGMKVLAYDVKPVNADGVERVQSLEELLTRSNLVTVHVNLDEGTRRLFGRAQFSKMKRGAFFINTSRGDVVDEAALIEALDQGHLGGAAVDVLTGEPQVSSQHAMVQAAQRLSNLLIVPHIGGNTFESFVKTETFVASKLLEVLRR